MTSRRSGMMLPSVRSPRLKRHHKASYGQYKVIRRLPHDVRAGVITLVSERRTWRRHGNNYATFAVREGLEATTRRGLGTRRFCQRSRPSKLFILTLGRRYVPAIPMHLRQVTIRLVPVGRSQGHDHYDSESQTFKLRQTCAVPQPEAYHAAMSLECQCRGGSSMFAAK
ncbi:hypothetical protein BC835DRAFT_735472 [Cytidiella melzeri]|nr:hypothetical protein BC835DRAFT_735472 [Cytidiella melzeri]